MRDRVSFHMCYILAKVLLHICCDQYFVWRHGLKIRRAHNFKLQSPLPPLQYPETQSHICLITMVFVRGHCAFVIPLHFFNCKWPSLVLLWIAETLAGSRPIFELRMHGRSVVGAFLGLTFVVQQSVGDFR